MEKKQIFLKDITPETQFPVVDLLKADGSRLGCCPTAMTNWIMRLGAFDKDKFANIQELALSYEIDFNESSGTSSPERAFSVIDKFLCENVDRLEKFIYRADTLKFEAILFLLVQGFVGLVATQGQDEGHLDIIFKEGDKVFFNCFEVDHWELSQILFSAPHNMFCFARKINFGKKLVMTTREIGELTVKVSEKDRYMLRKEEVFFLENDLMAMFDNYPQISIPDLVKMKEHLLKNLGYIEAQTVVIEQRD